MQIRSLPDFERKYDEFLEASQSGSLRWAEGYRKYPLDLAYLSLFAFLDKKVNQEELFISHMLASAFFESPNEADYTVLTSENIEQHLKENGYLTADQSAESLPCLKEFAESKTPLERTSISYVTRDSQIDRIFHGGYLRRGGPTMGFTLVSQYESKVAVLPPALCKSLFREIFAPNFGLTDAYPPTEHAEFFGYKRKIKQLERGRPISYASPLFYLPEVHNTTSTQLGITVHDLLGHCVLDWLHPYARHLIDLGLAVKELGPEFSSIALNLLDRGVEPLSQSPDENIAVFIATILEAEVNTLQLASTEKREQFLLLRRKHLPKGVIDFLEASSQEP